MAKHSYTKKQRRIIAASKRISVFIFALLMIAGMVTGLLFFARPTESEVEKRTLTAFPAFTLSSFLDGSWFSDISTWYSDTYPGRETLIKLDQDMENLYGITTSEAVYGGGVAEAIPDASGSDADSDTDSDAETAQKKEYTRTELPDTYSVTDDVQAQVMQGLLVKDGAVYGAYYFVNDSAADYINMINRVAAELEGTTTVYSMLIPNNSGVLLDTATMEGLGGSDPLQAMEYYYASYDDSVVPVAIIEALREHSDEYLYFRTDHHWTALGAYYAYVEFCEAKGIEPHELDYFEEYTFEPFLGSYYSELQRSDLIEDSVTGYVPAGTNDLKFFYDDPNGQIFCDPDSEYYYNGSVFNLSESVDAYNQYLRFIEGDRGFEVIDNPDITDGSSCVVIKESYGNAFVPFLVDHYDKVYVVDFRYNDGGVLSFCLENEVDDLIFANNMQIIASSGVPATIDSIMN